MGQAPLKIWNLPGSEWSRGSYGEGMAELLAGTASNGVPFLASLIGPVIILTLSHPHRSREERRGLEGDVFGDEPDPIVDPEDVNPNRRGRAESFRTPVDA